MFRTILKNRLSVCIRGVPMRSFDIPSDFDLTQRNSDVCSKLFRHGSERVLGHFENDDSGICL